MRNDSCKKIIRPSRYLSVKWNDKNWPCGAQYSELEKYYTVTNHLSDIDYAMRFERTSGSPTGTDALSAAAGKPIAKIYKVRSKI